MSSERNTSIHVLECQLMEQVLSITSTVLSHLTSAAGVPVPSVLNVATLISAFPHQPGFLSSASIALSFSCLQYSCYRYCFGIFSAVQSVFTINVLQLHVLVSNRSSFVKICEIICGIFIISKKQGPRKAKSSKHQLFFK